MPTYLQDEQSREFLLRAEVLRPMEIIRSAIMKGGRLHKNRLH